MPSALKTGESTTKSCIHHWIIELATKPVSQGKCRKCQKVKSFNNQVGRTGNWPGWKRHPRKSE